MVVIYRWLLYRNTVSNNHLIKWLLCTGFLKKSACQIWHENYLGSNQPFMKFIEAANNFTKLLEVGKHYTKFVKFANNFMKIVEFAVNFTKFVNLPTTLQSSRDSQTTFMMFVEAANNFTKLAEERKLHNIRKRCKQLYKVCGTCQQLLESP